MLCSACLLIAWVMNGMRKGMALMASTRAAHEDSTECSQSKNGTAG